MVSGSFVVSVLRREVTPLREAVVLEDESVIVDKSVCCGSGRWMGSMDWDIGCGCGADLGYRWLGCEAVVFVEACWSERIAGGFRSACRLSFSTWSL